MERKVVIVGHEPLTNSVKKNFYIDVFQNAGIAVEYWDVSGLVHKNLQLPDKITASYNVEIESVAQFENLVKRSLSAIYVLELYDVIKSQEISKILISHNCFCGKLDSYSGCTVPLNFMDTLLLKINSFYSRKPRLPYLITWLSRLVNIKINKVPLPPVKFFLNSSFYRSFDDVSDLKINSINYEKYIAAKRDTTPLVDYEYAVFLDEYLPYHPDFKFLNAQSSIEPDRYYRLLNNFFDDIEKKHNLKVVIAAHPKSDYINSTFKNRKVIKFETERLVRDCKVVIVHSSLSVDFAILFKKPIFFTYTNDLKNTIYSNYFYIKYRSALLNLSPINLNLGYEDKLAIPPVDVSKYDNYKHLFLTSPSTENKSNSELILSYINTLPEPASSNKK